MEESPSGRVISIDTDDFDEFKQRATGWSVRYHPLDATPPRSSVFVVATASMQVALVHHTTGYSSQGENPASTLSVAVPVDGAPLMVHCGHDIGPMQMGVIRSGKEYECVARAGARFMVASVAEERVERLAAVLLHRHDVCQIASDRFEFADSARRSRYLDACGRVLRVVKEQPGVLGDQRAAALVEETFLETLLLNGNIVPFHAPGQRRYNLARQAYRYVLDHADEVISIREICAVTGASYATLERGFCETYGMTPKAMMRALRLSGARRALLRSGQTTTVTAVALEWGFFEFGRFSLQYRQRYGESPSDTLRRVRQAPVANRD